MAELNLKCEHCGGTYEYVITESIFIKNKDAVVLKEKKRNHLRCSYCRTINYDTYSWSEEIKRQRIDELKKIITKKGVK